jgi:hypothetical protein
VDKTNLKKEQADHGLPSLQRIFHRPEYPLRNPEVFLTQNGLFRASNLVWSSLSRAKEGIQGLGGSLNSLGERPVSLWKTRLKYFWSLNPT